MTGNILYSKLIMKHKTREDIDKLTFEVAKKNMLEFSYLERKYVNDSDVDHFTQEACTDLVVFEGVQEQRKHSYLYTYWKYMLHLAYERLIDYVYKRFYIVLSVMKVFVELMTKKVNSLKDVSCQAVVVFRPPNKKKELHYILLESIDMAMKKCDLEYMRPVKEMFISTLKIMANKELNPVVEKPYLLDIVYPSRILDKPRRKAMKRFETNESCLSFVSDIYKRDASVDLSKDRDLKILVHETKKLGKVLQRRYSSASTIVSEVCLDDGPFGNLRFEDYEPFHDIFAEESENGWETDSSSQTCYTLDLYNYGTDLFLPTIELEELNYDDEHPLKKECMKIVIL